MPGHAAACGPSAGLRRAKHLLRCSYVNVTSFAQNHNNVRSVLSDRVAVKGRGRRPLFIFIIIYNLDVGVRAASVIIIFSSVSTVITSVCYTDIMFMYETNMYVIL